jgi:hypothetical protein
MNLMIEDGVGVEAHGHEVFDLDDAVFVREAGHQNICGGPIKLLVADLVGDGGDLEAATLGVVEDRAKDAGGVKVRRTVPINGAVHADQRDGAHVADDAVVLDR